MNTSSKNVRALLPLSLKVDCLEADIAARADDSMEPVEPTPGAVSALGAGAAFWTQQRGITPESALSVEDAYALDAFWGAVEMAVGRAVAVCTVPDDDDDDDDELLDQEQQRLYCGLEYVGSLEAFMSPALSRWVNWMLDWLEQEDERRVSLMGG